MIKILSTQDVAEKLGVSETTVFNLKRDGVITPIGKHSKTFMYDADDIEEYIGDQEVFITLSDGTEVNESFILEAIERMKGE